MSHTPKGQIAKRLVFNPYHKIVVDESSHVERSGLYAHFCYEWDEMLIDETDPEFACCNCGKPNART